VFVLWSSEHGVVAVGFVDLGRRLDENQLTDTLSSAVGQLSSLTTL
jgi:hypothetical protein